MNALTPITGLNQIDGVSIADKVDLWRGRYIGEFAMAETAISEALTFLSEIAYEGAKSLLPHLIGQRFEALRVVVDVGGPLAATGGRVAAALNDFRDHHRYRAALCHGSGKISVDGSGRWCLALQLVNFRAGLVERSSIDITEGEAIHLLDRLSCARRRLDGQLRGFLFSLRR
jgi:hypothetical protein